MINQSKSVDPMPPKKPVITENEQRESEGDYENDEFENKDMVQMEELKQKTRKNHRQVEKQAERNTKGSS